MGVGLIIGAVVAIATAAVWFMSSPVQAPGSTDMSPAGLDSFSVTSAQEGAVVPLIYGTVRLRGNILWYGNLHTVEITQKVSSGGKGGGGSKTKTQVTGHQYYLDVWQAICLGPVKLEKTYKQGDEESVPGSFNNGTGTYVPSEPGALVSRMPGVAHVFYKMFYVGDNTTHLPTLHFVVTDTRTYPSSLYPRLSGVNGVNPAAILWDILYSQLGISPSKIDMESFSDAALFWKNKQYYLSMTLSRQESARDIIKRVLSYVGGTLIEKADGVYSLIAHDPKQAVKAVIDEKSVISCTFKRPTFEDVPALFTGKYIDSGMDFSERVIVGSNPAVARLSSKPKEVSVDLTAFTTFSAAQRRLWEIVKSQSYPTASITLEVPLTYISLQVGDIVKLSYSPLGVSSADFRITAFDVPGVESNVLKIQAEQVVETLSDDSFTPPDSSAQWTKPDYTPVPLAHTRIFELPRNPLTGSAPSLLVLAAREKMIEDSLAIYSSPSGTDYKHITNISTFAQYGTLDNDYPITLAIDDDHGLRYTPYKEDPLFGPVSRSALFDGSRYALIGDEIVSFQLVRMTGTSSVELSGMVRGLFNTPVQNHRAGSDIWLFYMQGQVVQPTGNSLHLLLCPQSYNAELPQVQGAKHKVSIEHKAARPWPVSRIEAARTAENVNITWWPCDILIGGAGVESEVKPVSEPVWQGHFEYSTDGRTWSSVNALSCEVQRPGWFYFYIRAVQNGYQSQEKRLYAGPQDGVYTI